MIFLLRVPILALLGGTLTETAYKYSLQFMMVLAITTVGTSYQMACDNGIIRGGGDTKFSAKMNIISMWLIVVPFSAMAAFWWKFPPAVSYTHLNNYPRKVLNWSTSNTVYELYMQQE